MLSHPFLSADSLKLFADDHGLRTRTAIIRAAQIPYPHFFANDMAVLSP
jgi:hypothetical protein